MRRRPIISFLIYAYSWAEQLNCKTARRVCVSPLAFGRWLAWASLRETTAAFSKDNAKNIQKFGFAGNEKPQKHNKQTTNKKCPVYTLSYITNINSGDWVEKIFKTSPWVTYGVLSNIINPSSPIWAVTEQLKPLLVRWKHTVCSPCEVEAHCCIKNEPIYKRRVRVEPFFWTLAFNPLTFFPPHLQAPDLSAPYISARSHTRSHSLPANLTHTKLN